MQNIKENRHGVIIIGTIILLAFVLGSSAVLFPIIVDFVNNNAPDYNQPPNIVAHQNPNTGCWTLCHEGGQTIFYWKLYVNTVCVATGFNFHIGDCIELCETGYIVLRDGQGVLLFWGVLD